MEKKIMIAPEDFSKSNYTSFSLVADIGGTNATIAIAGAKSPTSFEIIFKHLYYTREISTFEEVLNTALREAKKQYGIETSIACIAAAGPLERERTYVRFTNCGKEIDTKSIIKNTLLERILLLNDFEANGFGLDALNLEKDAISLNPDAPKTPDRSSSIAALGAGTGLGMSIAYFDNIKELHVPIPSEGGHITFAPASELEYELMLFIKKNYLAGKAQPDYEEIVSGRGMEHIYEFLEQKFHHTPLTEKIAKLSGIERLDMIKDSYTQDLRCKKTIDLFMKIYARAARNLAVASCCQSGLFIVGKIAQKYWPHFSTNDFLNEFRTQAGVSAMLKAMPLYLVTNLDLPLLGCANAALNFKDI